MYILNPVFSVAWGNGVWTAFMTVTVVRSVPVVHQMKAPVPVNRDISEVFVTLFRISNKSTLRYACYVPDL